MYVLVQEIKRGECINIRILGYSEDYDLLDAIANDNNSNYYNPYDLENEVHFEVEEVMEIV